MPSLVGKGYSFGTPSTIGSHVTQRTTPEDVVSPFSETAPGSDRQNSPFSLGAAANASQKRNAPAASTSSGPTWSKSFSGFGGSGSRENKDDDDEEVDDPRDVSQNSQGGPGPTTPIGIPLGYNLGRRTSVSAESLDPSAPDLVELC